MTFDPKKDHNIKNALFVLPHPRQNRCERIFLPVNDEQETAVLLPEVEQGAFLADPARALVHGQSANEHTLLDEINKGVQNPPRNHVQHLVGGSHPCGNRAKPDPILYAACEAFTQTRRRLVPDDGAEAEAHVFASTLWFDQRRRRVEKQTIEEQQTNNNKQATNNSYKWLEKNPKMTE